ncbi:hypothetical protein B0H11DRAFT_2230148 [Mycena galericulata]|nr:hypothetical protein B0H11DRAFT_2230148 [Mycena galericulata]
MAKLFGKTQLMFTTLNIASLLDVYCDECQVDTALDPLGLEADNNPVRELDALHPRQQVLLRCSARLHDKAVVDRDAMDAAVPSPVIACPKSPIWLISLYKKL